jgi:hypothetical protein
MTPRLAVDYVPHGRPAYAQVERDTRKSIALRTAPERFPGAKFRQSA